MQQNPTTFAARILLSQDSGGSSGLSSNKLPSKESLLAECVAIRLNSCVDESELRYCPTGCDVGEFISRYVPADMRASDDFGKIAQIIDSVINAVDYHCRNVGEPQPTRRQALLIAIEAFDAGFTSPSAEAAAAGSTAIEQLKGMLGGEVSILSLCDHRSESREGVTFDTRSRIYSDSQSTAQEKSQMSIMNEWYHAKKVDASREEIATLVDTIGLHGYDESRTFWEDTNQENDFYFQIGRRACTNQLTQALHLQAQAEVVFESKYQEMQEGDNSLLSQSHAEVVEQKLRLRACDSAQLGDDHRLMLNYVRSIASESTCDMFLRREALERLASVGTPSEDLRLLERLIESNEEPVCVRFTAEVTRRQLLARAESAE